MDVLLLVSAFNGLTQRVWCSLREGGHRVAVEVATDPTAMVDAVRRHHPAVVLCPFLKQRLPEEIWREYRTVVLHPGPVGDRGPSAVDYAILDGEPVWGVTAFEPVEAFDAGPIWATRTFAMPLTPPRKSTLYNGPVADAAVECVTELMDRLADPTARPTSQHQLPREVAAARARPLLRQTERWPGWEVGTDSVLRAIRAADGAPGVVTEIAGLRCCLYDAHPGWRSDLRPGVAGAQRDGAVLVGTGDGSIWIGHLRLPGSLPGLKVTATELLSDRLSGVPKTTDEDDSYREIRYRRDGDIGRLTFELYNGAMSTAAGYRIAAALMAALREDTAVLVLRGGDDHFCNGIDLASVEAAPDPAYEAWENVRAINEVCREIVRCESQLLIAAYTGNAGAGGAMLGLGADVVVARDGVVLSPFYDMGLSGSELHTNTLPPRVGPAMADELLTARLPISARRAQAIGLIDEVGPGDPQVFDAWLTDLAKGLVTGPRRRRLTQARAARLRNATWPGDEHHELGEMALDVFDDRQGFAARRRAFLAKTPDDGRALWRTWHPPYEG